MCVLNQNQPLVSIIIPVYNVQDYLADCLDSILKQSYSNIEIIAVDDGSLDSSPEILKEYSLKYRSICIILEKINQGQATARNIGIKQAKGKYILFVDADDFIEQETVEVLVQTIEQFQADFVRFNAKSFSEEGEKILQKEYTFNLFLDEQRNYTKDQFENVYLSFSPSPVLYLFKRDLIEKNNIRFKEHIIHEDELFSSLIFFCATSCVYINQSFYNRRYRQGSTMTKKTEKQRRHSFYSYVQVINYYNELLLNHSYNKDQGFFLKYRINSLYVPLLDYPIDQSEKKEALDKIHQQKIYYTRLYKNYIRLLKALAMIKKKVGLN